MRALRCCYMHFLSSLRFSFPISAADCWIVLMDPSISDRVKYEYIPSSTFVRIESRNISRISCERRIGTDTITYLHRLIAPCTYTRMFIGYTRVLLCVHTRRYFSNELFSNSFVAMFCLKDGPCVRVSALLV